MDHNHNRRAEKWRNDLRNHKSEKQPIKRVKVKNEKHKGFWKRLDEFS